MTTHYRHRVDAVINHVANDLGKTYSLDELAEISHFSKFHFHRLFRAISGETVSGMVNRLRLESAAGTLIYNKN